MLVLWRAVFSSWELKVCLFVGFRAAWAPLAMSVCDVRTLLIFACSWGPGRGSSSAFGWSMAWRDDGDFGRQL